MSKLYAISSLQEAEAYLQHPVLGSRLKHCIKLVMSIEGRSVQEIFGSPDDMKFRSSMTLFMRTSQENRIFKDALQKYFAGEPDHLTIDRLQIKNDCAGRVVP
jgi:uncharacterized protein (DUF1810 family)